MAILSLPLSEIIAKLMFVVTYLRYWLIIISLIGFTSAMAAPNEYYLPDTASYLESIDTPDKHIGHQVGEFHARHGRVVDYMRYLADNSPRWDWSYFIIWA